MTAALKIGLRRAVPADTNIIVELGLEALSKDPYENLVIDPDKVKDIAVQCISSASNFCYVSEINGKVVAAVSALVHPMLFYQRQQATVVQFYSRVPGEGIKVLRELFRWWRQRPGVKMLCFTLECGADPRIASLLIRLGARTALPVMMAMK